ncbi:MAG: ATP-dependent metalloprotease, partial [Gammaproteobacteria bacterium]
VTKHKNMADDTARVIDEEIRDVIDRNYERALTILTEKMDTLHLMAKALIKYETIDTDQIDQIMQGKEPSPPSDWDDTSSASPESGSRKSSSKQDGSIGGPASLH